MPPTYDAGKNSNPDYSLHDGRQSTNECNGHFVLNFHFVSSQSARVLSLSQWLTVSPQTCSITFKSGDLRDGRKDINP